MLRLGLCDMDRGKSLRDLKEGNLNLHFRKINLAGERTNDLSENLELKSVWAERLWQ